MERGWHVRGGRARPGVGCHGRRGRLAARDGGLPCQGELFLHRFRSSRRLGPRLLRGAVDPLESRHESDPARATDFKTQVTRFFLTGVLSAVVDYGLLQLLMALGMGYGPAKAVSFVAGTLTAYALNRRWTFQAEPSRARFVATMCLYALMFGVQWGLFMLLVPWFHDLGWATFWATTIGYVIAQGVATVTNFIVQRTVIFRVR